MRRGLLLLLSSGSLVACALVIGLEAPPTAEAIDAAVDSGNTFDTAADTRVPEVAPEAAVDSTVPDASCARCLRGGCEAGRCLPFVVEVQPGGAFASAAAEGTVVWIELGGAPPVRWAPTDGGAARARTVVSPSAAYAVATGGGWLFFGSGGGGVQSCLLPACDPERIEAVDPDVSLPTFLARDELGTLYWTNDGLLRAAKASHLVRYSGGTAVAIAKLTSMPRAGLAVDDQTAYFDELRAGGGSNLLAVPRGASVGATPIVVYASPTGIRAIAVDASGVYVSDATGITFLAKTGGVVPAGIVGKNLVSSATIGGLATFGKRLYAIDQGTKPSDGAVWSCDPTDCTPVKLMSGLNTPTALSVDESSVYVGVLRPFPVDGGGAADGAFLQVVR